MSESLEEAVDETRFSNFTRPERHGPDGVRYHLPIYLAGLRHNADPDQVESFLHYLRTSFKRAEVLGISNEPTIWQLRIEYMILLRDRGLIRQA